MYDKQKDHGLLVISAGTGINLALGVLYTWSIFKGAIRESIQSGAVDGFNWDLTSLNDPYAVCCLVFACTMVLAGNIQDRFGPRITAFIGGLLVGLGFLWISTTTAYWGWILGFGVLVGAGIAFGYSAATPAALKWFSPSKTGKIAGIVVSGFGLASVYIAPLATWLLAMWGLQDAMLAFGLGFFVLVSLLSTMLLTPPEDYTPKDFVDRRHPGEHNLERRDDFIDVSASPSEIVKMPSFWLTWLLYFIGAGAGLMVISSIAGLAKSSLGEQAFLAVAILAIGNAGGRIIAGIASDHYGRYATLTALLFLQALLMFTAAAVIGGQSDSALILVLLTTFIGFNYGSNLALFPAICKDLWGIEHFGMNYGILFTAWGIGGFVMSRTSEVLRVQSGSFTGSFIIAGILLIAGASLTLFLHFHPIKRRRRKIRKEEKQMMKDSNLKIA
ncbi:MAG: OFA family MFS transporter [Gammaproteobacteria bacterium]|jgi:MFS family permease|nr:OFA family MFS transporter [Gammaproteobacteria bacterium]MBT4195632.1 OFA family MFS transporter [Gammaproteobacteria bacterium]MBT6454761.1 OFA family MFS transporter [Gammaproteobacteria bacterium]MBT6550774.1 OFA family MFS transporter [Gammaproteobacteria bacterium]MBT6702989.1 OFA family MFS transporter [Gammaproteobacteria bacterium]